MAEVHGARGFAEFADAGVFLNVRRWELTMERDIEDDTVLKGATGAPFVGPFWYTNRGLHSNWRVTCEAPVEATPNLGNIIKGTKAQLSLTDGAGRTYIGDAFVQTHRTDSDRFALNIMTIDFQGSGTLALSA